MALIICPECSKRISDKADKCPHCGIEMTDELRKKAMVKQGNAILLSIGFLLLLFCLCYLCINTKPKVKTEAEILIDKKTQLENSCMDSIHAQTEAKFAIEGRLKAPRSAKFDWPTVSYQGECIWGVCGNVDAQNSFGAMIRTSYCVKVKFNKETEKWEILGIKM